MPFLRSRFYLMEISIAGPVRNPLWRFLIMQRNHWFRAHEDLPVFVVLRIPGILTCELVPVRMQSFPIPGPDNFLYAPTECGRTRLWFNGRISAFQADDVGSIPAGRI